MVSRNFVRQDIILLHENVPQALVENFVLQSLASAGRCLLKNLFQIIYTCKIFSIGGDFIQNAS